MSTTELQRRGLMFVLSSPSGAGKTSLTRALLKQNEDLEISISATTRPRRPGEVNGQDYYFVDPDRFRGMVTNREFLEYAEAFGNMYGTPRTPVEEALSAGKDVVFDIEWQGTQQLAEIAREDLVTVFILPPTAEALEQRLRTRAQDSEDVIRDRLSKAGNEITHYSEYDYVVINKDFDESLLRIQTILDAERLKRHRLTGLSEYVRELKSGL